MSRSERQIAKLWRSLKLSVVQGWVQIGGNESSLSIVDLTLLHLVALAPPSVADIAFDASWLLWPTILALPGCQVGF